MLSVALQATQLLNIFSSFWWYSLYSEKSIF